MSAAGPVPSAPVTLLAGPPTRLALALNALIRDGRRSLGQAGLAALPTRVVGRALRQTVAEDGGAEDFWTGVGGRRDGAAVLSQVMLFGPPARAYFQGELFPGAETAFAAAARAFGEGDLRLVVTIEPLHGFFLTACPESVLARVAATKWEVLYELSWADLVAEVAEAFPSGRVLVVTPGAAVVNTRAVLAEIFGSAASVLDPAPLREAYLSPAGVAALAQLVEAGRDDPETMEQLLAAHPAGPSLDELRARAGIDPLTATLLDQRFAEDLAEIETIPRVRVL